MVFDALGALLYAGAGLALGMIFHDAVADVMGVLERMGRIGLTAQALDGRGLQQCSPAAWRHRCVGGCRVCTGVPQSA